jgi:hypothetical protein
MLPRQKLEGQRKSKESERNMIRITSMTSNENAERFYEALQYTFRSLPPASILIDYTQESYDHWYNEERGFTDDSNGWNSGPSLLMSHSTAYGSEMKSFHLITPTSDRIIKIAVYQNRIYDATIIFPQTSMSAAANVLLAYKVLEEKYVSEERGTISITAIANNKITYLNDSDVIPYKYGIEDNGSWLFSQACYNPEEDDHALKVNELHRRIEKIMPQMQWHYIGIDYQDMPTIWKSWRVNVETEHLADAEVKMIVQHLGLSPDTGYAALCEWIDEQSELHSKAMDTEEDPERGNLLFHVKYDESRGSLQNYLCKEKYPNLHLAIFCDYQEIEPLYLFVDENDRQKSFLLLKNGNVEIVDFPHSTPYNTWQYPTNLNSIGASGINVTLLEYIKIEEIVGIEKDVIIFHNGVTLSLDLVSGSAHEKIQRKYMSMAQEKK